MPKRSPSGLDRVLGYALRDQEFFRQLLRNPDGALRSRKIALTPRELVVLKRAVQGKTVEIDGNFIEFVRRLHRGTSRGRHHLLPFRPWRRGHWRF